MTEPKLLALAGTGWRDTTRIASGDPALWRAIVEANAEFVLKELDRFSDCVQAYRNALANRQFDEVQKLLAKGKEARDRIM